MNKCILDIILWPRYALLNNNNNSRGMATFEGLGLDRSLCDACDKLGFKTPTAIQMQTIPHSIKGRDIIGLAQTGSGKTAAFVLPILHRLLDDPQTLSVVALAPTRELAIQISEHFEALGSSINLRCAIIVGGIDVVSQAIMLSKKPHVIIATPGRLVDHLENTKGFNLKKLKFLILDEADRLLDMDFGTDIDKILQIIPKNRQTFLFSATMTSRVDKLQRASLKEPIRIEVSGKYDTVSTLVQNYLFIPAKFKESYFIAILNELIGQSTIVFVSTCNTAQRLSLLLRNLGFEAIPLHGQMTQEKRMGALSKFKSGGRKNKISSASTLSTSSSTSIMIATDIASRGLDIPHVDLVINFDVPSQSKDYIHRVGRTARAGRSGKAITILTQYDIENYQKIEEMIGKKLEEYPLDKRSVPILQERVQEANRIAIIQMKEDDEKKKDRRKRGGSYGDADRDGNFNNGSMNVEDIETY